MASTREPFSKSALCPVANRQVTLSGTLVSLPGTNASEVARKNCSNAELCLKSNESLESISLCLLHSLQR